MRKQWIFLFLVLISGFTGVAFAQHDEDRVYFWPTDSLVKQKLAWWQDQKFGLLMHWGPYSQWGVVESWSLCPEDEDWCTRRGPYAGDYAEYRKAYQNLPSTFNPVKFNPERWARAAADAGMKYMVFTTKHHDGFCMFDTKQTDYRITGPECPFAANPRANIADEIFKAFRKEGMGIGAYFSKPDWHCPDYWDPYWPPFDRNPNYDLKRYPEKWDRYKDFTYAQIRELLTGYGTVDILWLDGGWVRQRRDTVMADGKRRINQDIDMNKMADMARQLQPGILVVDRAVEGPNQNYLTPEQRIPEKPLDFPWETCMTMANSWSYVPGDHYKSGRELIHLLCRIVSRGGNLLLNIGPGPDGEWAPEAYQRLEEIGKWMKINSDAIYGTKPVSPYESGNVVYTSGKDGTYAIYLIPSDLTDIPAVIEFQLPDSRKPIIELLGQKAKPAYEFVKSGAEGGQAKIMLKESTRKGLLNESAIVFRITYR
ncbi:MAG: alpha-L-fucosidase [Bacteroidales bacterium]|nr:alpha-L-fucosidase [Bacteroidales bacterium]